MGDKDAERLFRRIKDEQRRAADHGAANREPRRRGQGCLTAAVFVGFLAVVLAPLFG